MCGIAGQVCRIQPVDRDLVILLTRSLAHRGPDDQGMWFSADGRVGLGHRRLSILDLSPLGHQPMVSSDGRFVIVYNGEIYNFCELRQELERKGEQFVSNSDTEVLLALWRLEGSGCLTRLRGMYAFAVWDNLERQLWLVRDPLGIKPLYYVQSGDTLVFASEVKALKQTGIVGTINPVGVGAFLRWGSIPAPITIYQESKALPAASVLCWKQKEASQTIERYWDYEKAWARSRILVTGIRSRNEAVEWVREALLDSVRAHLVSDVPVGAFLSGGIDSTAVVSLMRKAGQRDVETFSITFDEAEFDESQYAREAARTYNTRHHEWKITKQDFECLKADFLAFLDQPTIDGFNIFCVSKLAHEHGMKVVTSGIGGDELFRGYPLIFRQIPRLQKYLSHTPGGIRRLSALILGANGMKSRLGHRGERLASLLATSPELRSLYLWGRELFQPHEIRNLFTEKDFAEEAANVDMMAFLPHLIPQKAGVQAQLSMLETTRYLGSQLLADSDTFSMAHSLELRVPLVDRVLFEQVIALSDAYFEDGNGTPKSLLVAAAGDIPEALIFRPKQGFIFPFERWVHDSACAHRSDSVNLAYVSNLLQNSHWPRKWAMELMAQVLQ